MKYEKSLFLSVFVILLSGHRIRNGGWPIDIRFVHWYL